MLEYKYYSCLQLRIFTMTKTLSVLSGLYVVQIIFYSSSIYAHTHTLYIYIYIYIYISACCGAVVNQLFSKINSLVYSSQISLDASLHLVTE